MAAAKNKLKKSKPPLYPVLVSPFETIWHPLQPSCIFEFENVLSHYLRRVREIQAGMTQSDLILKGTKPYIVGINELFRCLEKNELEFVLVINSIPELVKFHLNQLFVKNNLKFVVFEDITTLCSLFKVKRLSCVGIKRNQTAFGIDKFDEVETLFQKKYLLSDYSSVIGCKRVREDVQYKLAKIRLK